MAVQDDFDETDEEELLEEVEEETKAPERIPIEDEDADENEA